MKKQSLKKLSFFLILLLTNSIISQTTIFNETVGSAGGTSNLAISATTFDNSSLSFSGTADTRTSTPSTYVGASGARNVFFTNTVGRDFIISGINTQNFTGLTLSFGHFKSTTASNNELVVEVSTNGTSYSPLTYSRPTGTGTASWIVVTPTGTIPSVSNLFIRFRQTSATPQFRIDDIRLVGTPSNSISATPTALSSLTSTYGSYSGNTSFSVSGTGLSTGITITPPVGFDVSTTSNFSSGNGDNATPLVIGTGGTILSTTIYVRLKLNNAGNYTGNIVLSSTGATTVNVATNSTNTVNQKELTISGLTANNKVFDNNNSATLSGTPVLNGIVSGDEANVTLSGTPVATFNDATVGNNKPVTVTGYTLSGSAAANYSLTQPTGLTANIESSGLQDQTITFNPIAPVVYGDANFNLTATASSGLTVTYSSSNTNVATISGNIVTIVGAGTTVITASQAGDSNYNPATDVNQNLVVNPKNLTVSGATAANKEYDADITATITGGTLNGVINSDDVSFSSTGNFDDVNVGTGKNVTIFFTLSGTDASNYTVSSTTTTADITPKNITVTGISIVNKQYDTNNSATITGSAILSGVFFPDFSNVTLGGSPVATFNDASVANNKPVNVSGYSISGSASGNYNLVQPTGFTANITPKQLTVSGLTAENKVYDQNTNATITGSGTLNGIISGDEANINLGGSPVGTFNNATFGLNKTVTVSGLSLSGSSLANYTLAPLTLTASITKLDVTISGSSVQDKVYDGTTTATLSGTLSGVLSPDNVVLNLAALFDNANVGSNKSVTSTSTLSGLEAVNYNLIQPTGLTASITAAACASSTGTVSWNFSTATPSSNTVSGLTVSTISQGNNNGTTTLLTTTSASTGYAGASGTSNAGAAAFAQTLNTSTNTYFQFTLTPNSGLNVSLNSISFGSRSTSTGPQAYTLRSSVDNFTSDVATGTLTNNSVWVLRSNSINISSTNSAAVTFRLYGHNGTGSPSLNTANWRIDDLILNASVTPGAALSSPNNATSCSGDVFNYVPATNYTGATITWTRASVSGISNSAVTTPQSGNVNETLINTTLSPVNVTYNFVVTGTTCFVTQNVIVTVNPLLSWYLDADNDNYFTGEVINSCVSPGLGYKSSGLLGGGDCNDSNPAINPGATEICYDGIDNNCDNVIDEGCTPIVSVLQPSQCGVTLPAIDSYIYANVVSGAQGYRFRVTDMTTNQVQTIDKALRVFALTQLPSYAFNRTYQVEVSIRFNNVWQPFYGLPCLVTTPATTTQVQSSQCGSTLINMSDIIYANNVPFAAGYRFRITNLLTSAQQVIDRPIRDVRLTNLTAPQFNTTYSVEVAVRNTNGTYLPYGTACNVTSPSFPTTQVQLSQCDLATPLALTTTLLADSFTTATTYRFRFVNGATTIQVDRPIRSIVLSTVPGIQAGTQYSVSVALEINGTFGPFGKVCTVTTAGATRETENVKPVSPFNVTAYPNPFAENFKLNVATTATDDVQVKVYDMLGKLVENRTVSTDVINEIEVGANYPAGVYNVIVTQGNEVKTTRVIKR